MPLNLANGQLGSSSATVLGAGTDLRTVAIALFNTAVTEQTIYLAVSVAGGTARTLIRIKLAQYQAAYVRGVRLDPSDLLTGYSSSATSVDYVITQMADADPFSVVVLDSDGTRKQSTDVTLTTTEKEGLTMGEVAIVGLLEECRNLLLKIA